MVVERSLRIVLPGLALAALGMPPALAAEPDGTAPAIEEIQVTALRRQVSLQDVPDSMTVFDRQAIEEAGIDRLNDVAALTPNLRFSDDQEVGVGTITVRGVTQNRGIGETPVAFVVDGVSVNNSLLTTQDFFDVEQIEVLRGPQGALYGRNSVAGAINIISRAPTRDFEAYARTRGAEGDDYSVEGAVSGPLLGDKVLGRLAAFWQDRDGQLYNRTIGKDVDYKRSWAVRGRSEITVTDALVLELRYQHSDQEGGSGYFMPGSADTEENRLPGDTFPYPLNNTTYTIQSNLKGKSDVKFDEYSLTADYVLPWFTVSSITGYNDLNSNNDQDLDQTAQEFLNIVVNDNATQFSQELRLVSPADQPLRWLAGAYYSDQERDRSLATFLNVTGFVTGGDWSTENAFFVPQPPAVLNEDYDTRAVFAQLNYDLTERWELIAAGRLDRVVRQNDTNNPAANGQATFTEFQPKLQVTYRPREGLNLFATYAKGFRPGGFNTLANAPEVQFEPKFDSETLDNYELGVKYQSPGRLLDVSAALFYIDYNDQQFFLFDPFGSQALINADSSEIKGGELEVAYRPLPGLDLLGAYGFIESKIESIDQVPGLTVPADEIDGNNVPNAPVYTLNLAAQYVRPLGAVELSGRIDFERRGKTYFTIDNVDTQGAYNIVDLRLGVAGDRWRITGFVDNVFDEDWIEFYFSRRFIGLRTDIAWPSPKRQVGIEASYSF